jgi:hypothetical protein
MYGLMEQEFTISLEQEMPSNVVDLDSYRRAKQSKGVERAVLDWPAGVQVAWALAH